MVTPKAPEAGAPWTIPRGLLGARLSLLVDGNRGTAHPDAGLVGHDLDAKATRAADLLALEDRDRRRGHDQPVLAQVGAEGGGPRAGRGVLDNATNREGITHAVGRWARLPD